MGRIRPRLVLADDDEELRSTCATALESSGYEVVSLDDGFELSDYFELTQTPRAQRHQPDLVITDLRMPGPSVLGVLREARSLGLTCPVIVFTAFGDAHARDTAQRIGQVVMLDKPATQTALVAQIEQLLRPPKVERQLRVLVVDDDDEFRTMVGEALRESGCAVEEARDGIELNARVLADPKVSPSLDLVITDERMPWSGGLDVLERLKTLGWKLNFILMTSRTDGQTRARAQQLGATRVFTKPFSLRELVAAAHATGLRRGTL